MHGYWYSVKTHFDFSREEFMELFWTAIAFAFTLAAHYGKLFQFIEGDARIVISSELLGMFILLLLGVFVSLYFHVALQKLVGIRLGYKVTYSYWLNGILLGLFLSILTFGKIPVLSVFILPGAVKLESIPQLRLGKFRYGLNAKDIARVSLAGPISHILMTTFLGVLFFTSDRNAMMILLIKANLLILIYSMLPIPKIDSPTKMDGASDGLGIFFFSRVVYVLCAVTTVIYATLVWLTSTFSFILAFLLAILVTGMYSIVMKQPT